MCQAAQAGGTSQTKHELLAPLVKTKLRLLFSQLSLLLAHLLGASFWRPNRRVDSQLAACPTDKSKGGVAGRDPADVDLDRNPTDGYLQLTLVPQK